METSTSCLYCIDVIIAFISVRQPQSVCASMSSLPSSLWTAAICVCINVAIAFISIRQPQSVCAPMSSLPSSLWTAAICVCINVVIAFTRDDGHHLCVHAGMQTLDPAPIPAALKASLRDQLAALQKKVLEGQKKASAANKQRATQVHTDCMPFQKRRPSI